MNNKSIQNEKQLEQFNKNLEKHKNYLNIIFLYSFGIVYLLLFFVWVFNIAIYQWLNESHLTIVSSFFGGVSIGHIIIDKVSKLLK